MSLLPSASTPSLNNSEPADMDLVEAAFDQHWRHDGGYCMIELTEFKAHQPRDLDAYIFTMLRNAVSRLQRRKKTGLKALLQWASDHVVRNRTYEVPPTLPDDDLSKALNLLPEPQRIVLILKVIFGLSFKQISSVVGIKMNTAASRYRYAIQKLQSTLESEEE